MVGNDKPGADGHWAARAVAAFGKTVSWLTLILVVLIFVIVMLRYGFNLGWIWLQEVVVYLNAAVFMLAAAWTLQNNGHVRVDVFYRNWDKRRKATVNLLGTLLFLLPFCVFFFAVSWQYVLPSWQLLEGSREAGGLPLVFLLKSLLLLMPLLLIVQGLSAIPRLLQVIRSPHEGLQAS